MDAVVTVWNGLRGEYLIPDRDERPAPVYMDPLDLGGLWDDGDRRARRAARTTGRAKLCACGCGQRTRGGKFRHNHWRVKLHPDEARRRRNARNAHWRRLRAAKSALETENIAAPTGDRETACTGRVEPA
jgi:hypothetical protein